MELISTVKMKKAQESVQSSRPFALEASKILGILAGEGLFETAPSEPTGKSLVILVSSNKGLCGGYNIGAFKETLALIRRNPDSKFEFVTVGKRAREFVLRTGNALVADFSDTVKDTIAIADARAVSRFVQGEYRTGKYDKVYMVYGHYVSAITQKPVCRTFYPVTRESVVDFLAEIGSKVSVTETGRHEIEPSPSHFVSATLPLIHDLMTFEHLLEAKASEHAARMVAMKNAKDSAQKKAAGLTLAYNKARQSAITKEITEIVSGVESMKE